jgi:hypothetical protein
MLSFSWDSLAHFLMLSTIAGLIWPQAKRIRRMMVEREEDHKRINALWREHGYNGWNGSERRREPRYD